MLETITQTNIFYVYKHTFKNGAVYIGKGKTKRAYSFSNRSNIWNSHRKIYGDPIVEIIEDSLIEIDAFDKECEIIKIVKTTDVKLINLTDGGEGVSGYIASKELIRKRNQAIKQAHSKEDVKQRVSQASKQAHSNPITKAKHRESLKKAQTPELRAIKSFYAKGRAQSEETKAKRSMSMSGRELSPSHIENMSGSNHHSIDNREFLYYHKEYGILKATQSYMLKNYKCKASHLILGRIKTSKGWYLYDC